VTAAINAGAICPSSSAVKVEMNRISMDALKNV
jgi:hypothetical protein